MRVTVIGIGYVGLVTGACLSEIGNEVICLDVDQEKIAALNDGTVPIHERGLNELIERNRVAGHLCFTADETVAIHHAEIIFIAVGTPSDEDGNADLRYVLAAARRVGELMNDFKVVVNKSTVPVGTGDMVCQILDEALAKRDFGATNLGRANADQPVFAVVSNPEFLKEGSAVDDFMRPDRIVIGFETNAEGERARELLRQLYAPFNRHHERTLYMDVRSAEFTKYAANAMLATRISFMNELANLADKVGVDIERVRKGIGSDPRIGFSFLYAGTGYGGSCFPKDLRALMRTAAMHGQRLKVLEAVDVVNARQKQILLEKIVSRFGADLSGMMFAMWGLAFKPNTNDMREAPSRILIRGLLQHGAHIRAYDPIALDEARCVLALDLADMPDWSEKITFFDSIQGTTEGADALVIVTEWKAFRSPNFTAIKRGLRQPIIFDGRNLYEPEAMAELGFEYCGVGRQTDGNMLVDEKGGKN